MLRNDRCVSANRHVRTMAAINQGRWALALQRATAPPRTYAEATARAIARGRANGRPLQEA